MIWLARSTGLGLALVSGIPVMSAAPTAAPLPAAMERALANAAHELAAGGTAIRCEPTVNSAGYTCMQTIPGQRGHYALLAMSAQPAAARARSRALRVDSAMVGPGGGSTRYLGQTADHRFDIVVTQAEQLGPADQSRFPTPARVIARVAQLYAEVR